MAAKIQQRLTVAMWASWAALAGVLISTPAPGEPARLALFLLPHLAIALTFTVVLPRFLGDYLRCLVLGYVIKEREDQERRDAEAMQTGPRLVHGGR